jgi:RAB protein geranylgeranyltransferase component A
MEGDHFEDLRVDGRTISESILKNRKGWDGINWIHLACDWDK